MLEEFMLFGRQGGVHPWLHQLSCCDQPVLLFVEFCQVQGPRPLAWLPRDLRESHLDLDQVSLWLMSSENVHGSFCAIFNQQLGLHCLVQHATLFDVAARAFQRPFALALLTPTAPSPALLCEFRHACLELIQPLLRCNRRYFISVLERLVEQCADFPPTSTAPDDSRPPQPPLSNRVRAVAQQARSWSERLLRGSFQLSSLFHGEDGCQCSVSDGELEKFISLIDRFASAELAPVLELAPCAGPQFDDGMQNIYEKLTKEKPISGLLFSNRTTVLRSFFGANSQLTEDAAKKDEVDEGNAARGRIVRHPSSAEENSLVSMSPIGIVHSLFPLLSSDRVVAILASKQREFTGRDLLGKLNLLRLCRRVESVEWIESAANRSVFYRDAKPVMGVRCSKEHSSNWSSPAVSTTIDLNHHRVKGKAYSGRLLNSLLMSLRHGSKSFPSDRALMAAVAALITDINQLSILVKYVSFYVIASRLNLSTCDQLILINFLVELDLTKYSRLKERATELSKSLAVKNVKL